MADGGYTILHRKDERGVIVESGTFGPDDEVPEGFGEAGYEPIYAPREDHQEPVAESNLTPWESPIAVKGTWVENRPEDAEIDQGTPVQAREDDELTEAEREAREAEVDDESEDVEPELDEGSPRQAREESEDGELTGAEEEADEALAADADDSTVEAPPRGGAGSGVEAWAAYAAAKHVEVPEDASRDEIIEAVQKAGHSV